MFKRVPEHHKEQCDGNSWSMVVIAPSVCEVRSWLGSHFYLMSLRTILEALLKLMTDCYHWILGTNLQMERPRHCGCAAGFTATLCTVASSLLRIDRFESIREGLQAVMHDTQ